jgi:hypothetical protein
MLVRRQCRAMNALRKSCAFGYQRVSDQHPDARCPARDLHRTHAHFATPTPKGGSIGPLVLSAADASGTKPSRVRFFLNQTLEKSSR